MFILRCDCWTDFRKAITNPQKLKNELNDGILKRCELYDQSCQENVRWWNREGELPYHGKIKTARYGRTAQSKATY